MVAEYILTSCDTEGNGFMMFRDILDHLYDYKVSSKEGGFVCQPK